MIAQWNAPISDRFSSLCARVFSPAAAILESEKTLGTRLPKGQNKSFGRPGSPLSKGLVERRPTPVPLSQGLDPALDFCILSLQTLFNSWHSTDQKLYICSSFLLDLIMRFTTNIYQLFTEVVVASGSGYLPRPR